MIRNTLTVLSLAGLVAVVACTIEPELPYQSTDTFCDAIADAECTGKGGADEGVAPLCGVTKEACKNARKPLCMTRANEAVGRTYTQAKAEACITKTKELYSLRVITAEKNAETVEECNRVFQGNTAKLGVCQNDYQCTGTLVCDKTLCADKVEKTKQGDLCGNPGEVCSKGLYCATQGAVRVCVPKNTQGQTCTVDTPCLEDLWCNTVGNICEPRKPVNSDCTTDKECGTAAPFCEKTLGNKCSPKTFGASSPLCKEYGAN